MSQLSSDHPLLQISLPGSATNLSDWLQEWSCATSSTHLHALLHGGFSSSLWMENNLDRQRERLRFYLAIADGFNLKLEEFELPGDADGDARRSAAWVRKSLAEKAFTMLIRNVFKNTAARRSSPSWLPLLHNSETLAAMLQFLRCDRATKSMVNVPLPMSEPKDERANARNRELRILREFVLDLVSRGFDPQSWSGYQLKSLEAAHPQFIELLIRMDKADRLIDRRSYPFHDNCWGSLEALAWEPLTVEVKPHCLELVAPSSIEAAAALGSKAAQILILRRGFKKYDDKQVRIESACTRREEAETELQQLSS